MKLTAALVTTATLFSQVPTRPPADAPAQPSATPAPAPLPNTDSYEVKLSGGLASMKSAKPTPVSVAAGYDNQPMYSPDGARILFAVNREGKQTDIYVFDRATGRVTQVTHTPENENSPTFLPAGIGGAGGFSVVQSEMDRTQRLWRFDAQGQNPQLILKDIKPVGYHAWVDADHVALFVLGQPATLQLARVSTGQADTAAGNIGRSLHRIPNTRLVSFSQREASGDYWIKQIDVDTRQIEPIVKAIDSSSDRDYAWMPDGKTILMTGGNKVFAWSKGAKDWIEVFDGAPHHLGALTRLNVSPKGDAVAIVSTAPAK
jgi:Tol biopolymer transport system component